MEIYCLKFVVRLVHMFDTTWITLFIKNILLCLYIGGRDITFTRNVRGLVDQLKWALSKGAVKVPILEQVRANYSQMHRNLVKESEV